MPETALSVVIPVYRDAEPLGRLLATLRPAPERQLIVANGVQDDIELEPLRRARPDVVWVDGVRGRGAQMNAGAARAVGRWLLFLHADALLSEGWTGTFAEAEARGASAGCYRLAIDAEGWQPRLIEWGVRLRVRWLGVAYGDQGLFVKRARFEMLGGYQEQPLMEDADLVRRLRRTGRFHRAKLPITVSARRWQRDGWWRRTGGNLSILLRHLAGQSPQRLAASYPVWRDGRRRCPPIGGQITRETEARTTGVPLTTRVAGGDDGRGLVCAGPRREPVTARRDKC